jgi:hypothetical protein
LNTIKLISNSDIFICDIPGYCDNRGVEIEISNTICISKGLKVCKAVKPLLLLNFHEIKDGNGSSLKETLKIVAKYVKDINENF